MIIHNISQHLTLEQEIELGRIMKHGNEKERLEARNNLVEANIGLVYGVVRACPEEFVSLYGHDELISALMLKLVNVAGKYDYERGYKFSTFAVSSLKNHIVTLSEREYRKMEIRAKFARDFYYLRESELKKLDNVGSMDFSSCRFLATDAQRRVGDTEYDEYVKSAVSELSKRERRAIQWKFFSEEDLTNTALARMFGYNSSSTIKKQLDNAFAQLREKLKDSYLG